MASDSSFQPLQMKGEIMDMEFTIDTDHRLVAARCACELNLPTNSPLFPSYSRNPTKNRKRRRNRTTQSCLNCHTSKRKVRNHCPRRNPQVPLLTTQPLLLLKSAIESGRARGVSSLVWYVILALLRNCSSNAEHFVQSSFRPASASTKSMTRHFG